MVENMFVRHVIPYAQGRYFVVDGGLFVQLNDGRAIPVRAWDKALYAALTGYASYRAVRDRIQAECARITHEHPPAHPGLPYRRQIWLPAWPLLPALLLSLEAVGMIAHLIRFG